jgi:hypothetical protein
MRKALAAFTLALALTFIVTVAAAPKPDASECDSGFCEQYCWDEEFICETASFGILINRCLAAVAPCLRQCYDSCGPPRN